jgi:8-oxo-dGTP pyrophosphatase MutT (NUDIX family)
VPGGGIEEGETVAETAVREVKEETGIDAEYVRTLGRLDDPEGHFVHLRPRGVLPETWTHRRSEDPDDVVLCRWQPLTAEFEVWGERGAFLHALRRRRQVIVYVTRENPETGFDEFLVFDVADRPEFTAVVPGGGIDEGETVEVAAIREAREETGLDVEFVRELGVAENPGQKHPEFVQEGHYVHSKAPQGLPNQWEHHITGGGEESGAPVRCRWIPVRAEVDVWGLRGSFVHALVRKRVVAYVTRGRELLVFDHGGTTQVPAGRVDHDETLEEGLVREVEEETGVVGVRVVRKLADGTEFARLRPGSVQPHESHAFHAVTDAETPDAWTHYVTGTGMDAGMQMPCRWVPLDDRPLLWGKPDPFVEMLRSSIRQS